MEQTPLSRTTVCLLLCVYSGVHLASELQNVESSGHSLDTTIARYERTLSTEAAAISNKGIGKEMTPAVVEGSEEAPGSVIGSLPRTTQHQDYLIGGMTEITNEIADSNTFPEPSGFEFGQRSTQNPGSLLEGMTELTNEMADSNTFPVTSGLEFGQKLTQNPGSLLEGMTELTNEMADSNTFPVTSGLEFGQRLTQNPGSLVEGMNELTNEMADSTVTNSFTLIPFFEETRQTSIQTITGGLFYNGPEEISVTEPYYRNISAHVLRVYARSETLGIMASTIGTVCPEWKPCYGIYEMVREISFVSNPALFDTTCCLECSCTNTCYIDGTCCPGFEPNFPVEKHRVVLQTSCLQTVLFNNSESLIESNPEYEMVINCPDDTPADLQNKCTALLPGNVMETGSTHRFIDVIPVTDSITLNTFANWYCASCNGLSIDDLRFWKTDFTCTKDDIPLDKGNFKASIQQREDCYLTVRPPTETIAFVSLCFYYKHVETRCNVTGHWMNYDPEIDGLCKTVNWLYEVPSNGKKYKNIFCAACNGERIADHNATSCPSLQYDESINMSDLKGTLNMNTATDDRLSTVMQPFDSSVTCPKGERFDPLSVSCRKVVCSYLRQLNYMTMDCEDVFGHINLGLVEMEFEFVPSVTHYIKDIQAFKNSFIQLKKDVNSAQDNCIVIDAFYKIDQPYSDFVYESDLNERSGRVIAIFVLVIVDLRIISRNAMIEHFSNVSVEFIGKSISFVYGTVDSFYLPSYATLHSEDNAAKYARVSLWNPFDISRPAYILYALYEDPYDGFAILFEENAQGYDNCASKPLLYDMSYFRCPSFVYDTHVEMISRTPDGVVFVEHNITLVFGQFRSMNYTHIAICVDIVYDIGLDDGVHSSAMTNMRDVSLYSVCCMAVRVTVLLLSYLQRP